jgi:hypothetical protein
VVDVEFMLFDVSADFYNIFGYFGFFTQLFQNAKRGVFAKKVFFQAVS